MDGVNDTDVIAGDETTPPAAPAWMTTQSPKLLTKPLPKTRKPRRTKAQMIADAAARADAEGEVEIHTSMAAEDTIRATARDLVRLPQEATTPTDRLAIVACFLALLALSVAIVAIVR